MIKWTDIYDIAISLDEVYPGFDVLNVSFTDLHAMVIKLEGFQDNPLRSNEKILEAIQAAWIEEQIL